MQKEKIQALIEASKQVFKDCSLPVGAIIAANTDLPYYPKRAANYHFVWPRDAAFVCVAAQKVGVNDIQEKFFEWLEDRPEGFKKTSLLYQNYAPNGKKHRKEFQPDQTGACLWSLAECHKNGNIKCNVVEKHETLIRRLADGLSNDWQGKYFFNHAIDLWEEGKRHTSSVHESNHTYSLASCAKGLLLANEMIKNENWVKKANQMIERINFNKDNESDRFLRNKGKAIADRNVDASLLGLTWPFEIIKHDDSRMIETVKKIEEKLVFDGKGVHRYENDYYDGEGSGQEGSGAWPLLNFWMTIYWCLRGNKAKAEKYFNWVLDKLEEDNYGNFIPEQIFNDDRRGVYPLAWSHAMFIFAVEKLYPELLNENLKVKNEK